MSFMKRAQEAAAQVAAMANQTANDPATQEQISRSAREALGVARRGVTTVVEKIDPATLAESIVRATRPPGDDEPRASRQGVALSDRRDLDLRIDPSVRELLHRPDRRRGGGGRGPGPFVGGARRARGCRRARARARRYDGG